MSGSSQCQVPDYSLINLMISPKVGLSVIVYKTNPRPDGLFSDRLAPDTLLLDFQISDRHHLRSGKNCTGD